VRALSILAAAHTQQAEPATQLGALVNATGWVEGATADGGTRFYLGGSQLRGLHFAGIGAHGVVQPDGSRPQSFPLLWAIQAQGAAAADVAQQEESAVQPAIDPEETGYLPQPPAEPETESPSADWPPSATIQLSFEQIVVNTLLSEDSQGTDEPAQTLELRLPELKDANRAWLAAPKLTFDLTQINVQRQFLDMALVRAAGDAAIAAATKAAKPPERATTDAKGWFRFDCPEDPSVELVLLPREDEWIADARYTFDGIESPCRAPFEWRVEVASGRKVAGRVLDAKSLQPLAGITVECTGERDASESITTDGEGRFATELAFPAAHVAFALRDGDDEAPIRVAPAELTSIASKDGEELLLLAAIGPTWRFTFTHVDADRNPSSNQSLVSQEQEASEVEVRLVGAEPWPGSNESARIEAGDGVNPFAEWRRIRAGRPWGAEEDAAANEGWLRYASMPKFPRGGTRAEFRTTDGRYAATVVLEGGSDAQHVALQRTSSIHGRIAAPEGVVDASIYRIVAARAGGGAGAAFAEVECAPNGYFGLEGLDVGTVRSLEIWRGDERVRVIDLELSPAEVRAVDLEL
jgi:hypothetical protein